MGEGWGRRLNGVTMGCDGSRSQEGENGEETRRKRGVFVLSYRAVILLSYCHSYL